MPATTTNERRNIGLTSRMSAKIRKVSCQFFPKSSSNALRTKSTDGVKPSGLSRCKRIAKRVSDSIEKHCRRIAGARESRERLEQPVTDSTKERTPTSSRAGSPSSITTDKKSISFAISPTSKIHSTAPSIYSPRSSATSTTPTSRQRQVLTELPTDVRRTPMTAPRSDNTRIGGSTVLAEKKRNEIPEGRRSFCSAPHGIRTRLVAEMQEYAKGQENRKPMKVLRRQSFLIPMLPTIQEEGGISNPGKLSLPAESNIPQLRDADPFFVLFGHIEKDSDSESDDSSASSSSEDEAEDEDDIDI